MRLWHRGRGASLHRWIAAVVVGLLAGTASAQVAFTPSGTLIEAQASATFLDAAAMQREALSNVVVTVVQKVARAQVSGEPVRAAVAGASVDLPFTVTNAGNDSDTFDLSVAVTGDLAGDVTWALHADENCNGRTDAGEPVVASVVLDRGDRACIVVRASIAAGTTQTPPAEAVVTFTATSTTSATVEAGDQTDSAAGTVVLTDAPVLSGYLQATPSAQVAQGAAIAYQLQVSNTGASSACAVDAAGVPGVLVRVAIPAGLTLEGTPTVSSGAGTPSLRYAGAAGAWLETPPADLAQLAVRIEGTGCFFPQGASAELRFTLRVGAPATPGEPWSGPAHGTSYTVSAASDFAESFGGDVQSAETNAVSHVVLPAYAVGIDGGDAVLAEANSGSTIELVRGIRNLGNATDSIHLELEAPAGSAWLCRLYRADGVTPLIGPVGPLAPNAARDVVVRCEIPAEDTEDGRIVTLTARSAGDADATAQATWTVASVDGGLAVDLALQGVPSDERAPGSALAFFALVTNQGANPDTYGLSALLSVDAGSPATWSAATRFFPAALVGGTCQAIAPRPASVSTTGILAAAPGANARCFEVEVTVPANASSDWQGRVTVSAISTTSAAIRDDVTTGAIRAALVSGLAFGPNRSATVTSPGIVTVSHTVRNTGNAPATFSLASGSVAPVDGGSVLYGWTEGGTFHTAAALPPLPLAAGAEATLHVRLMAASGQPAGRRITVATDGILAYATTQSTGSVTNTYDVIDGSLRLLLDVCTADVASTCSGAGAEARPGQYLHYTLVASNLGSAPLAEVVVTEPVPAFTDFVSVLAVRSSGFTAGTIEYDAGGGWSATPPAAGSVASGDAVRIRVHDGDAHVPIPAGGSVTITLVVRVR